MDEDPRLLKESNFRLESNIGAEVMDQSNEVKLINDTLKTERLLTLDDNTKQITLHKDKFEAMSLKGNTEIRLTEEAKKFVKTLENGDLVFPAKLAMTLSTQLLNNYTRYII